MSTSHAPSSELAVTAVCAAVFCVGFGIAALISSSYLRIVWGGVSLVFAVACLLTARAAHCVQRTELTAAMAAAVSEPAAPAR